MRLKQVRLSGFKSFCDNTNVDFLQNGITMVVGPNGCGKSNVVDAVRWALGEQSPRMMRGSAMGDLIFSGSTSRKPVGRAEVTLLFDNSERTAIEKFNEYAEIAVTRRLYRSGDSDYLINKIPCRLMDVRELMMDTGGGGRSYSIVEQGRVDEFVTASPLDRRAFMEEAAGIVRYKTKRIAAEKKLDQTRQNLLRVQDVLSELHRQEGVLRDQMETARAFRTLQEEVELLKGDLARVKHDKSAAACRELEEKLAKMRLEGTGVEQALMQLNAQQQQLTLGQTRQESELRDSRAALYNREREIQQRETRLALERQNLENIGAWSDQLRRTREELQGRRLSVAEQLQAAEAETAALEERTERMALEIGQAESACREHEERALELSGRATGLHERLLESHTQLTGIENQQRFLAERLAEDEKRREGMEERKRLAQAEQEQVRQELEARRGAELAARVALAEAQERVLRLTGELETQTAALEAHRAREGETERELLECRSRLETLRQIEAGYEGFGESVRAFLNWLDEEPEQKVGLGVVAPLADLVTVPADVVPWAGDYLAPHLETIVIEQASALPRLAERLEALKLGGVRFLALDALAIPGTGGATGGDGENGSGRENLTELLSCEERGKALGEALFGATCLLPSGSAPHPLPPSPGPGTEWLARDGAFHVDAKGRVTLGRGDAPGAGVLNRRAEIAELQSSIGGLEGERERLRAEGETLQARLGETDGQRRAAETSVGELSLTAREEEGRIGHLERERERLEQVREAVERDSTQFEQELTRYRGQQAELASETTRWQGERERLEGELGKAREEEAAARTVLTEAGAELTEQKVEHGRLYSRLDGLRSQAEHLRRESGEGEQRLGETEAAMAAQQEKREDTEQAIMELSEGLKTDQSTMEALRSTEREHRQAFEALSEQHNALAGGIQGERRKQEANQAKVHELELALTAERMRLEQFAEQLTLLPARKSRDEHGDDSQQEDGQEQGAPAERTLENKLNAAQARLQRMEGVNLGAPEEYETLNERLTFLAGQQEDLNAAVADLESSIRAMNSESRRRFQETFEQVNEKFQALFPQVFGGGEASLVLTDSEDPLLAGVDIVAQPPGKKLSRINLLSGGEKALTAISLIFSFFLYKPSPFCLLDEVDAPLDDVNVTRFNQLIQNMTDHSQFIIITHNKRTMEVADRLYGVTMEEAGVSKIVSVNLTGQA